MPSHDLKVENHKVFQRALTQARAFWTEEVASQDVRDRFKAQIKVLLAEPDPNKAIEFAMQLAEQSVITTYVAGFTAGAEATTRE